MWKQGLRLIRSSVANTFLMFIREGFKRIFQTRFSLLLRYCVVFFLLQGCQKKYVYSQPNIEQKQQLLEQVDLQTLTSKQLLRERSIPLSEKPYPLPYNVPFRSDSIVVTGGRFQPSDLVNIVYVADNQYPEPVVKKVLFCSIDNEVLGEVDVHGKNPYSDFLKGKTIAKGFFPTTSSYLLSGNCGDVDCIYAMTYEFNENPACKSLTISYFLNHINPITRRVMKIESTIVAYDQHGRLLGSYNEKDLGGAFSYGDALLSCDGSTLVVRYGGEYTASGHSIHSPALKYYDVNAKRLKTYEVPSKYTALGPSQSGKFIKISMSRMDYATNSKVYNNIYFSLEQQVYYLVDVRANFVDKMYPDGFIWHNYKNNSLEKVFFRELPSSADLIELLK